MGSQVKYIIMFSLLLAVLYSELSINPPLVGVACCEFLVHDFKCRCGVQVTYDYQLARFYMWAQTEYHVLVAVYVPTGAVHLPLRLH